MGSRILVVEDSAVIRRLIEVCLRAADLEIVTRDDGKSGLHAVSSESPDLVVLDIGLPGMDGWEVLDRIRRDDATKSIPVVVLTAHAEEESRRRSYREQWFAPANVALNRGALFIDKSRRWNGSRAAIRRPRRAKPGCRVSPDPMKPVLGWPPCPGRDFPVNCPRRIVP